MHFWSVGTCGRVCTCSTCETLSPTCNRGSILQNPALRTQTFQNLLRPSSPIATRQGPSSACTSSARLPCQSFASFASFALQTDSLIPPYTPRTGNQRGRDVRSRPANQRPRPAHGVCCLEDAGGPPLSTCIANADSCINNLSQRSEPPPAPAEECQTGLLTLRLAPKPHHCIDVHKTPRLRRTDI